MPMGAQKLCKHTLWLPTCSAVAPMATIGTRDIPSNDLAPRAGHYQLQRLNPSSGCLRCSDRVPSGCRRQPAEHATDVSRYPKTRSLRGFLRRRHSTHPTECRRRKRPRGKRVWGYRERATHAFQPNVMGMCISIRRGRAGDASTLHTKLNRASGRPSPAERLAVCVAVA